MIRRAAGLVRRLDRGDTLIEIAISIAIMGIVLTAVLGALSTGLLVSHDHATATTTDVTARNAQDFLAQQTFAPCGPYSSPPGGGPVTIEYWDSGTSSFVTSCPSPTATPYA